MWTLCQVKYVQIQAVPYISSQLNYRQIHVLHLSSAHPPSSQCKLVQYNQCTMYQVNFIQIQATNPIPMHPVCQTVHLIPLHCVSDRSDALNWSAFQVHSRRLGALYALTMQTTKCIDVYTLGTPGLWRCFRLGGRVHEASPKSQLGLGGRWCPAAIHGSIRALLVLPP